ncbi:Ig-like domain-containing protein [Flammeovirga sp. EKP202]|uniref:Ig-like domain-containing protein n=1 Tax=Flammeovirga sp. EKP202 TaxID=2770592 RepID=UPI00165EC1D6|nr:Ig-like domain-containing protein [Flammeovirga sp. EKP202]MBD0405197.1 Ig-like domain-containing protein [Flammeovirga sp. EKP202]
MKNKQYLLSLILVLNCLLSCQKEIENINQSNTNTLSWYIRPDTYQKMDSTTAIPLIVKLFTKDTLHAVSNADITFELQSDNAELVSNTVTTDSNGVASNEIYFLNPSDSVVIEIHSKAAFRTLYKRFVITESKYSSLKRVYQDTLILMKNTDYINNGLGIEIEDHYGKLVKKEKVKYEVIEGDALLNGEKTIFATTTDNGIPQDLHFTTGSQNSVIRASVDDQLFIDFQLIVVDPIEVQLHFDTQSDRITWNENTQNLPYSFELLSNYDSYKNTFADTLKISGEQNSFINSDIIYGKNHTYRVDIIPHHTGLPKIEGVNKTISSSNVININEGMRSYLIDSESERIYVTTKNNNSLYIYDFQRKLIHKQFIGVNLQNMCLFDNKLYIVISGEEKIGVLDLDSYAMEYIDFGRHLSTHRLFDVQVKSEGELYFSAYSTESYRDPFIGHLNLKTGIVKKFPASYNNETPYIKEDKDGKLYYNQWNNELVILDKKTDQIIETNLKMNVHYMDFSSSGKYIGYSRHIYNSNDFSIFHNLGYYSWQFCFSPDEKYFYRYNDSKYIIQKHPMNALGDASEVVDIQISYMKLHHMQTNQSNDIMILVSEDKFDFIYGFDKM